MHQYYTAVLQVWHNSVYHFRGGGVFPVKGINIPLNAVHIKALYTLYNSVVVVTVGRSEQLWLLAGDFLNFFVTGFYLIFLFLCTHFRHMWVGVAVVADVVTCVINILYIIGVFIYPVTYKEKGGFYMVFL